MPRLLALLLLLTGCSQGSEPASPSEHEDALTLEAAQSAYLEHVDTDYSFALAKKLEDIRSNEALGYRTAGSEAELRTGDMLKAEMEAIGLSDVTRPISPPAGPRPTPSSMAARAPRRTWRGWT